MDKVREPLQRAHGFLERNPNLDGSRLLKKEATALVKALNRYNEKTKEVELSLTPDFAETAAILEGDGRRLVTPDFVRDFTGKHCSETLTFSKANKKERTALLLLAAQDGKLRILKKKIDPSRKYREMYQSLLNESETIVEQRILEMKAADFRGIVNSAGLDAPRIKSGAVSTSKASRKKVLKQILRDKTSEELMDGLSGE